MIKEILEQMNTDISLCTRTEFSRAKKEIIRGQVVSFMDAHPAFSSVETSKEYIEEPHFAPFDLLFFTKMKFVGMTLIITLTLGASVSYAAQDALPGDSLYGIKTNVNEGVRGWFARSPKQEARLHVIFAEERMKETEILVAKGGIKPEIASELEENFKKQADAISANISKLTSENKHEDALEVSAQFESSLKAHESVLSGLDESASTTVSSLIGSVEGEIGVTQEARILVETKIKEDDKINKETARTKMRLAKDKIAEVSLLVEQLQEMKLIEKSRSEGETKLKRAEKTYDSGRAKYLRDSYTDSFVFFEKAKQEAEEAKTYLTVSIDLDAERKKFEEAKKASVVETGTPTSIATSTPVENATTTVVSGTATSTLSSVNIFSTTTFPFEIEATTTLDIDSADLF